MTFTRIKKKAPRVVIVGRPNVGKSTLFNRLIGKRKAITDPTPGVTRDPVEASMQAGGHTLTLIDTGGYKPDGTGLDDLVTQKSLSALETAELILFIMDVTEITAEDESFLEHLRRYSDKVLLVVNKVDNQEREQAVWNFHSYGFEHVVGVSAAHGINMDVLHTAIISRIDFEVEREDVSDDGHDIAIAVLGKPNTGKSTLINILTGKETSIVSNIPGTTRDVVEGVFTEKNTTFKILDTAGIRRKSRVGNNVEYYSVNRAINAIDEADVILLMIDVEESLTDQDKKIAALIVERGKGIILVLNKWDKMPRIANQFEAVKDRVRFLFPVLDFAPVIPISALKEEGIEELLKTVRMVYSELGKRVDTGRFNRYLRDWVEEYAPPMVQRKRFKIRYGTQVGVRPVRFVLFVNRKYGFPAAYVQYILNKIRKVLGFHHIPVELQLRESEKGDAPFLNP